MNEEVVVRFGGDLTPLGNSLRGMKGIVADATSGLKSMFSELSAGFSAAMVTGGIKKLLADFDELDDRAQNLGVSNEFLQGMQHIAGKDVIGGVATLNKSLDELSVRLGEAKDGSEPARQAFEKWGITLSEIKSMNTEEMFYEIADKISGIRDPAVRSAAAFELLGKSGKQMGGLLAEGSKGVKDMVEQVDKLDEVAVKNLAQSKSNLDDLGNRLKVGFAMELNAITSVVPKFLAGGYSSTNQRNAERAQDAKDLADAKARHAEQKAQEQSDLKARADAIRDAQATYELAKEKLTSEGNLRALTRSRLELQRQIEDMDGESVEKYTKMAELQKAIKEEAEAKSKVDEDAAKVQKDRIEKLEKEKTLSEQISATRFAISSTAAGIANSGTEYPDMQEVANSGNWAVSGSLTYWQSGPNAGEAQDFLNAKKRAKNARAFGNIGYAEEQDSYANSLQKDLQDRGIIKPDEGLAGLNQKMAEATQHLQDLLDKAKTDGIKVKGPED